MASASRSTPAAPWPSSVNRAAARASPRCRRWAWCRSRWAASPAGRCAFEGRELVGAPDAVLQDLRGNGMAMIFQEPMTSLNPAFTIGEQIVEALLRHRAISRTEAHERALAVLRKVRMPAPEQRFNEHPHKLSGAGDRRCGDPDHPRPGCGGGGGRGGRGCRGCRQRAGDVCRAGGRAGAGGRAVRHTAAHPAPRACSARCRGWMAAAVGWPPSKARCPARCSGPPAAALPSAARLPTPTAMRWRRRCAASGLATWACPSAWRRASWAARWMG